nr:MAG TPA: cysteine-rich protein [Caudoviricetes sp.]
MRVSVVARKWWSCLACCGLVTGLGCSVVGCPYCWRPLPLSLTPLPLHCCPCPLV